MDLEEIISVLGLLALFAGALPLLRSWPAVHLHPVHGPAFAKGWVLAAKGKGLASSTMTLVTPEGETCQGAWEHLGAEQGERELQSVWDAVYGNGFFVAHILDSPRRGHATLRGEKGTALQLEFCCEKNDGHALQGVARDNRGNLYKIV